MKQNLLACFICALSLAGLFPCNNLSAQITIQQWQQSAPREIMLPAFANVPNTKGDTFALKNLFPLITTGISDIKPDQGTNTGTTGNNPEGFYISQTQPDGFIIIPGKNNHHPSHCWINIYVETSEYSKSKIEFFSPQLFEVYINGELKASKYSFSDDKGKASVSMPLPKGKYQILVKSLTTPADTNEWKFKGIISPPDYIDASKIQTSFSPSRIKTINDIYAGTKISGVAPSFDGQYYSISFRKFLPSDKSESWTEIRKLKDNGIAYQFKFSSVSQLNWAPKSNRIAFVNTRDKKTSLFILDLTTLQISTVLENIENFAGYSWSPDESYFIYSINEEAPKTEGNTKQILNIQDRLPGYRDRSFVYYHNLTTHQSRQLTYGNLSAWVQDISPDAENLIISLSQPDYTQRPFSKQQIIILNVNSLKADTLFKDLRWSINCAFSPDGKKLLITGGSSAFGNTGTNVPQNTIPNNYDTQAYVFDLTNKDVDPITLKFDPSVQQAVWNKADNLIYIVAQQGDRRNLFQYDLKKKSFSSVTTGVDITQNLQFADSNPIALYLGESISTPSAAFMINLKTKQFNQIENTEKENYKNVVFGQTKEWDYTTSKGVKIQGRVYFPIDYKPEQKYPVLVYYYGGTTPVQRSFGGRYPFNLFASQGYLVYVLQPSGSIGYGQEFSAAHVNNWGITVADEIIESTKAFLQAHPAANASKVGCMGASYGGFMTMLLQTRTDIFAAAISHAGISNIASYWGVGYWGVGYSTEATAESFPWNRPDIYVDQSPLYRADRIKTPLLLLHGDADTNVPPGESLQMFAALKILGKPVELVMIKGEDHQILTPSKRIEWNNTILAWFELHLKDKPQWWNDLYPKTNY